jgi:hypothetical protein
MSFSNIKTSASTNFSDAIFKDNTISTANPAITASNRGLANATPKWIINAWRADINTLPFTLTDLQSTYGNSTFQIGPGFITYTKSVPISAGFVKFNIVTNVANLGFASITAYYPPGVQTAGRGAPTYGTFDCLFNQGGIDSTRIDGGCLANLPTSNNFQIYVPFQYYGGSVTITISLNTSQTISNIFIP